MNLYLYVLDKTSSFALVRLNMENKRSKDISVSEADVLAHRMTMRDIVEGKAQDYAASLFPNEAKNFKIVWGNEL